MYAQSASDSSRLSSRAFTQLAHKLVPIMVVALLFCATMFGQLTSGNIFGTVKDSTGAVVPNASVTAASKAIGVTRTATSSTNGTFAFTNLPPGTYTVSVEATGFKKLEKSGVILNVGDRLNAGDFELGVGADNSVVTVSADAGQIQLQSNSGERSDLVTGKQLNDIALDGRNVLDMLKIIPGVTGTGNFAVSGTGGVDTYNINGTRANQHEFTIDGASNVDTGNNGGTHVTLNTDSIAEVKVLTSNYQAEFGKAAGGSIAVATRSGTNQYHGNLRFFHRNEGMNAHSWFDSQTDPITPKQKFRYNDEGYQFGGPIPFPGLNKNHDKLFFFWSQEFYQQLVPGGLSQYRTPTALERQGDFSQSVDANGKPLTIYDPVTHLPIAGNKINPNSLNAQQQQIFTSMQNIMNLYPLPNVSGNLAYNRQDSLSYDQPRREDILRVDYQLTNNERLYARWVHNSQDTTTPMETWNLNCMGQLQVVGGCKNTQPGFNLAVNLTSTITPTLLNEFSIGPSAYRSTWTANNGNLFVGSNNINLPLLYAVSPTTTIPDVSFSGNGNGINYPWSYFGANPWFQANTTINVNDNLSWVKKSHAMKFGFFYQRNRKDQIAWGNSNGQFNFNNCPTSSAGSFGNCASTEGSPYASALLGYFNSFNQSSSRPTGYFRYNQFEWYAQDTWKVTSRLTLDYGMRFAWIPPQYDDRNQIALFVPSLYDPASAVTIDANGNPVAGSGSLTNGFGYSSNGTLPKGGWKGRGLMAEPRFGFAWDPYGNSKTVVRGGFGMMHDRTQGNLVFNTVFGNPLNVTNTTVQNGTLANLAGATAQAAGVNGTVYAANQTGKVPTVYSYSFGIQQDLGAGTILDLAYVGTLSRHLVTARDINQIPYGTAYTAAAQNPANFPGGVVPAVQPNLPPEYAAAGIPFTGEQAYASAALVPYKGYSTIEYYDFNGTSNYNSLQASLQRRFSRGLTAGIAYTWSKSLTTANSDEDWQDPFNPRGLDYRAAGWDRTHVVAVNYVYDIPGLTKHFGGPKWLGYITDGYQLSGVSNFMTGTPVDNQIWVPGNQFDGSTQWGKTPPVYLGVDKTTGNLILPALGQPYKGTRDTIRQGGMQNWDMSLFKNIPFGSEQRYLQLRVEAFNVFNHPNFQTDYYNATLTLPSYNSTSGTYTPYSIAKGDNWGEHASQYAVGGVGGPRVIQLGAKFYF